MDEVVFLGAARANRELVIDSPRLPDIPALVELSARFYRHSATQRKNFGYVPAIMNEAAWKSSIAVGDVVCAKARDGRVAGFYTANQYALIYGGEELRALRAAQSILCNRYKLAEENVSLGAQVVIDVPWQGSGLRPHLLRALLRNVGLRYRYLFSMVKKDNPRALASLPGDGWRCFHEEDDARYEMLNVARALRMLASRLVLQLPDGANRPPARAQADGRI